MIDERCVSLIIRFIINPIIRHSLTIKKPMGSRASIAVITQSIID